MTFIAAKRIASIAAERRFYCSGCGYIASGPTASRWHECPKPPGLLCGPGCQLRRTLSWWGIRDDGKCGCDSFAAKMDAWGPDECFRRIEEIVEHLRETAGKKGLPFIATAARIMVGRAIEAARAEATPPPG
jgi:hypothetical protein